MGASHHPYAFLKLLVLFLGISYVFFSLAGAVPATRSVKGDVIIVKTGPFALIPGTVSLEFEGEGRMELEVEKENDYPEPGPNPRHDPPPNPSSRS